MKRSFSSYARVIENFRKHTILHLGDLVLDQFLFGEVGRISREAPVLILKYRETINIPGGGANAIHNLLTLGARVCPVGVLGLDEAGEWLYRFFKDFGVNVSGLIRREGYTTPVKTRILAGSSHSSMQQMLRIDKEESPAPPPCTEEEVTQRIDDLLPGADAVLVSDYGYQLVRPRVMDHVSRLCRDRRIPLVVDSRFSMRSYAGITSMTPNISEVESAYQVSVGEDLSRMDALARRILVEQELNALLITRGRFGMSLYQEGHKPVHISVFGTDEVADVTGAGDTVISVYTLALTAGAGFELAARLSNYAGGLVVMKRGTATVSTMELLSAIRADLNNREKPQA